MKPKICSDITILVSVLFEDITLGTYASLFKDHDSKKNACNLNHRQIVMKLFEVRYLQKKKIFMACPCNNVCSRRMYSYLI